MNTSIMIIPDVTGKVSKFGSRTGSGIDLSILNTLVIENDTATRASLCGILGQRGHHVTDCPASDQGIAGVRRQEFQIVIAGITDFSYGIQVIQWLRQHMMPKNAYLMVMIPSLGRDEIDQLLGAGADELFHQESTLEQFQLQIARCEGALLTQQRNANDSPGNPVAMPPSQFERLFRQFAQAVAIVPSNEGSIMEANDAAANLFGVSVTDLNGSYLSLIVPELYESKDFTAFCESEELKKSYEDIPAAVDGKELRLDIAAQKIIWEGKKAVTLFFQDTASRRRIEEEKIEEHKNEAINVMALGIAQDLNNILTALSGNLVLMNGQPFITPETRELILNAESACTRAQNLAHRLVNFSPDGETVSEPLRLRPLLEKTVQFNLYQGTTKPQFQFDDSLWQVSGDELQISQLISNITENAHHAMPEGGTFRVAATNFIQEAENQSGIPVPSGKYVKILFTDEGTGISEPDLPKIFNPYFASGSKGEGLGLTLSKAISKKHRGHLDVEKTSATGTTIALYLPASPESPALHAQETVDPEGARVLFMDDESDIRLIVNKILSINGFDVYCAADGQEAIDVYRKAQEFGKPFDVLIFDLDVRGGIGGKEAIARLRAEFPNIKAIVTTGYTEDIVLRNHREYGFSGILTKPFKVENLVSVVSMMAGKPQG